ncbi:hypothetical protein ACRYI5_01145 [Furfurilactobacillus sp. WILCCON 0119]
MKQFKLNFNVHSGSAWTALLTAIVTGGIGVATALGWVVSKTEATTLYGGITTIVSIFTAAGVLTATDKHTPEDTTDDGYEPKH